jgi:hypothetical protein
MIGAIMRRVNKNETPEERFKRVAEARTNAVLNKLRILGNLSNRQRYGYSDKDISKIFSTINRRVREIRTKFDSKKERDFKL